MSIFFRRVLALIILGPVLIISLAIIVSMEALGKWLVESAKVIAGIWRAMT